MAILVIVLAASFVAVFGKSDTAVAATSSTINFQARLLTAAGAVVPDGQYNVEFKLYTASTGGSAAWTETRISTDKVRVVNGYLTVNLGSVTAFSGINWDQELWLTMNIGGTGSPSWDGEMTPRLKLTAVPYAFTAGKLVGGTGANTTTLDTGTPSGNNVIHLPAENGTLCIQNSANCGFALSSGAGNYIQNQNASQQAAANFWISGVGRMDTALQSPAIRPTANGTTAIQFQNAAGSSTAMSVDTTNSRVSIGNGGTAFAPAEALDVIGNIQIRDASTATKGYRLRTSGSALDFEASGADLYLSNWSGASYTGTQRNYLRLESGANIAHAVGSWQFAPSPSGTTRHTIDGTIGTSVTFNQDGEATNFTIQGDTDASLFFVQGSTDRIGIGTNSPGYKLDVNGDVNISTGSVYRINGQPICSVAGCVTAPSSGSYIQNQNATQQTSADFWISGNGRADTALQTPLVDTATAVALNIGTTNATVINLNKDTTLAAGKSLNIGSASALGALTVQPGTAATIGAVIKGAASQTGDLLQFRDNSNNVNASFNSTGNQISLGRIAGSGTVTQGKIILSDGTTSNFGATLQTNGTLAGNSTFRLGVGSANGTYDLCTTLSVCTGYASSTGSGNYIQNQNASQQATANFWISGNGRADTSLQTPLLDTATAVALNIGTTNATAINLNKDTTLAVGKTLSLSAAAASTNLLFSQVTGDTNPRFTIAADGTIKWGAGSGATDTTLSRSGTGVLTVNNGFIASTSLQVGTPGVLGAFTVQPGAASTIASVIKGAVSQTADLLQFRDSNDNVNSSFNSTGNQIALGRVAASGTVTQGKILLSDGTTSNFGATLQTTGTLAGNSTFRLGVGSANGTYDICSTLSVCTGYAASTGSGNYIQNQNASQQATANFWISGNGRADTSLQTPLLDTATAVALNVGTTNATAINLNKDTTLAVGKTLSLSAAATSTNLLFSQVTGDTNPRFTIAADGTLKWGPGNAATDTTLSRTAVGALTVNSGFIASTSLQVGTPGVLGAFTVQPGAAGTIAAVIKGAVSQTGDLLQLRDSNDNINASVNAAGNQLTLGRVAASGTVTQGKLLFSDGTTSNFGATLQTTGTLAGSSTFRINVGSANGAYDICTTLSVCTGYAPSTGGTGYIQNSTSIQTAANFYIQSAAPTSVGGIIRGAASQTSSLLQLLDGTSGYTVAQFSNNGYLSLGSDNISRGGQIAFHDTTISNGFTATINTPAAFSNNQTISLPDESGTICIQSSANCGFAATTGGTGYIQNQFAAAQSSSNFWISGTGRAVTLQAGTLDAAAAGVLNIGTSVATSLQVGSNTNNTALTFDSGTGAINMGTGAQARTINIGTGGAAQVVTVGSQNGTSSLTLDAGTGTINIGAGAQARSVNVATGGANQTVIIGSTSGTSTLTLDSGTGTINIGNGAQARTVNVATGAAAQTVTVGSTNTTSTLTLTSGTGTINMGTFAAARTVNIATAAAVQTVTVGSQNGASTLALDSGTGAINIGAGAQARSVNVGTGGAQQAVTVGSTNGASTLTLDSGTGTINIGNGAQARTVNVATGAANQVVSVGSTSGTSSLTLQAGTGTIAIGTSASARIVNIATAAAVQTVTVGSTNGASTLTLDSGTGALNIGAGAQARSVNVGTGAAAQTVTVGSQNTTSSLTLDAGTGTIAIGTSASARTTNIATGAAQQTVTVGSANGGSSLVLQSGTGNVTIKTSGTSSAFLIQDGAGQALFNIDASGGWTVNNGIIHPNNLLENPSFEAAGSFTATGWNFSGAASINASATAHHGNKEFVYTSNGTLLILSSFKYLEAQPGDQFYGETWYKAAAGTNGGASFSFTYYDKSKSSIGSSGVTNFSAANTSYTLATVTGTAPAGTAYVRLTTGVNATSTTGSWTFDDYLLTRSSQQAPFVFKNNVDSNNALMVQNTAGNTILNVNTSSAQVELGKASDTTGKMAFYNSTNGNAVTVQSGVTSAAYTLTLPTALGITGDCLKDGGSGVLQFTACGNQSGTLQAAYTSGLNGTTPEIIVDSTRTGVDIQDVSTPGSSLGTAPLLAVRGQATATTLGPKLFSVQGDGKVAIGNITATEALDVAGNINISSGSSYKINGTDICTSAGCTAASGSGYYIQNQSAGQQATSTYWISGTGRADTSLQAPLVDTATGVALNIGTTNATAINLNQNTIVASGKSLSLGGTFAMQPAADGTSVFNVKTFTGSNNFFTMDTSNLRVGINLGGSTTPAYSGTAGIEIKGGFRMSAASASYADNYTTPLGSSAKSMINIANYDPGAGSQLLAWGLNASANATSRAIALYDNRAGVHTPTIAVVSPNETENGGFSWDGSNTEFRIKNSSASGVITLNINGTNRLTATTTGVGVNTAPSASLDVLGVSTAQNAFRVTGVASNTVPVALIKGGATPGSGADILSLQDSSSNVLLKVDNDGDTTIARSLNIGYTAGIDTFTIQGVSNPFVTVNPNNSKFYIGDVGSACGGRFCVNQPVSGTGGSTYTNIYNNMPVAVTTGSTFIGQDLYISDTSSAVANTVRGIRLDFTGSTNTSGSYNGYHLKIPSTVSNSSYAGNALWLQNGAVNLLKVTNTGATTLQNTLNSAAALQVTSSGGANVLTVDTTNSRVGIGNITAAYALDVSGDVNITTAYKINGTNICISTGCTASSSSAILNQNASTQAGVFKIQAATDVTTATILGNGSQTADVFQIQSSGGNIIAGIRPNGGIYSAPIVDPTTDVPSTARLFIQASAASSNSAVIRASASGTGVAGDGSILRIQNKTGTIDTFAVGGDGNVTSKNLTNSTAAFTIQDSSANTVLNVDTTNQNVGIGTNAPTRKLDISTNTASSSAQQLLIRNAGSGDAGAEYKTNGQSFYTGIDSTDDSFNITSSTASGNTSVMGYNTVGASTDTGDRNTMNATKWTAAVSGNITSIYANVGTIDATPANQLAQVALYTNNAGSPGTLIASSASVTLTANAWNAFTISSTAVTSGTTYWIVYNTNGLTTGVNNLKFDAGAANQSKWMSQTYGTWPAWAAGTFQSRQYSMYAVISGASSDNFLNSLMTLSKTGAVSFQNSTDSSAAFNVLNAAGTALLSYSSSDGSLAMKGIGTNGGGSRVYFGDQQWAYIGEYSTGDTDQLGLFGNAGVFLGNSSGTGIMSLIGTALTMNGDATITGNATVSGSLGAGGAAGTDAFTVYGNGIIRNTGTLTKQYRWRTTGSALDFEGGGAAMFLSTWTGVGFTGTQQTHIVMNTNGTMQFNAIGTAATAIKALCIDTANARSVLISNAATSCTVSSARYKKNIQNMTESMGLDTLMQMRPVTFQYKTGTQAEQVGFIAEDMDTVLPQVVEYDDQGRPNAINYEMITSNIVKGIQQQQGQINGMQVQINNLRQNLWDGGIVSNDTTFNSMVTFNGGVDFKGDATFEGKVNFMGKITYNRDAAGTAVIPHGFTSVDVIFGQPYDQVPQITISSSEYATLKITNKTVNGFTINMKTANNTTDVPVDWIANQIAPPATPPTP